MQIRQLRSDEILGIWSQISELAPYESAEEMQTYASGAQEFMIADSRGPAHGFLVLVPWKENPQIRQIITPGRAAPKSALLEHAIELSDKHRFGLITPLSGSWNLRPYRRYGFRPIQKILAYLKADTQLPVAAEWVDVKPLRRCGATAEQLAALDVESFVPFWRLSPSEVVQTLESELALGIHTGEELLGYASAVSYGRQGSIGRLAINHHFRRQGLGSSLLQAMISRLHSRGMLEIGVTTQEENMPARRLSQSFGFGFNGEYEILGYPHTREHELWGL